MSTKSSTSAPSLPPVGAVSLREHEGQDAEGADDIIDLVRQRLLVGADVSDVTIAATVAAIAARDDHRGRWLAAFGSPLGRYLAARGDDIGTALANLVALSVAHET